MSAVARTRADVAAGRPAAPRPWPAIHEGAGTAAVVRRAIRDLPRSERLVIVLRDVKGWRADEVAEALALTEAEQRALLHRARTAVRDALDLHLRSLRPL